MGFWSKTEQDKVISVGWISEAVGLITEVVEAVFLDLQLTLRRSRDAKCRK
jgi:hypothetical protein